MKAPKGAETLLFLAALAATPGCKDGDSLEPGLALAENTMGEINKGLENGTCQTECFINYPRVGGTEKVLIDCREKFDKTVLVQEGKGFGIYAHTPDLSFKLYPHGLISAQYDGGSQFRSSKIETCDAERCAERTSRLRDQVRRIITTRCPSLQK